MHATVSVLFECILEKYNPIDREYRELQYLEDTLHAKLESLDPQTLAQYYDVLLERQTIDLQAFFSLGMKAAFGLLFL